MNPAYSPDAETKLCFGMFTRYLSGLIAVGHWFPGLFEEKIRVRPEGRAKFHGPLDVPDGNCGFLFLTIFLF